MGAGGRDFSCPRPALSLFVSASNEHAFDHGCKCRSLSEDLGKLKTLKDFLLTRTVSEIKNSKCNFTNIVTIKVNSKKSPG